MRIEDFKLYKPRKNGAGSASKWNVNVKCKAVFLELSQQIAPMGSEKMFDWDNKLIMKLGVADLGELIATLENRQQSMKLFHQTEDGNSTLNISKNDKGGWFLNIGVKKEKVVQIKHSMSLGEGAILLTLLRQAVLKIYAW